jgi:hypothetical protein
MVVFMAMTIMACTKQIQMHAKNNSKLYINFMKFLISIEKGIDSTIFVPCKEFDKFHMAKCL